MKITLNNLRLPAVTSTLLVLPLILLEWVNRRGFNQGFPLPLFGILWLLPAAFILVLRSSLAGLRTEGNTRTHRVKQILRITSLVLLAGLWLVILQDQMPCFLGVPNCD